MTPLDTAHDAMTAAPDDDGARLRFYERLADSELFLMLAKEPVGEEVEPELFDTGQGHFVLVFDREDRLAQFAGRVVPYAGLSGRVIAGLLAEEGIGLGLNLEVAPSSILIPAEAIAWLAQTLGHAPDEVESDLQELSPPTGLPETLLTALDTKLATAAGLARFAYLVATRNANGAPGHMLGFIDAVPGAEEALAKATGEALTFSGIEAGALDVGFFRASDVISAQLASVGLRFDLPEPETPPDTKRAAPGSDPENPPILR